CVLCHVADWTDDPGNVVVPAWSPDGTIPPMFTDFTYDNLGVPESDHRLLANNAVDPGLGGFLSTEEGEEYLCDASPECDLWDYTLEKGKFKVMTLRNVHQTAPYAHNGFFKTLEDITHFYNTRDVVAEGWPDAEWKPTVNPEELGNLGLSAKDEDALVKFMKTLTDGWVP
ncbi:MAG TPA: hypothetical protein VLY63_06145, partial [Anaerolineae bacterium]|nr:hypothetical protein [Anaerolineae bacterium]